MNHQTRIIQLFAIQVFTFLSFVGFTQGYQIEVKVNNFQEPNAYLAYYLGDKQYIKDTVSVDLGQFTFRGEEKLAPGIYMVVLPPDNQYFELIIDHDQQFSVSTDLNDLIKNIKVSGSKENELFYEEIKKNNYINNQIRAIDVELQQTKDTLKQNKLEAEIRQLKKSIEDRQIQFIENHPNSFYTTLLLASQEPTIPEELKGNDRFYYYFDHYFNQIDFSNPALIRTPILSNKVNIYLDKLSSQNPDSLKQSVDRVVELAKANDEIYQWSMIFMLNKYAQSKIVGQDAVYCHIIEKYYAKNLCPWVDETTLSTLTSQLRKIKPTLIGAPAPKLFAKNDQGVAQDLAPLKGNYVFLYFWKNDCSYCQQSSPKIAGLAQKYSSYPVKFVTINKSNNGGEWEQFLIDYGLNQNGIINWDGRDLPIQESKYNIKGVPMIYLLDKNHNILSKLITVEQVEMILDKELGLAD